MTGSKRKPGPAPGWKKLPEPSWSIDPQTAADRVYKAFGGPRKVADLLGVSYAAVYRWSYPKERRGSGGSVPTEWHSPLLEAAREQRVRLERADLVNA
jgi:hypothetical protein